MKNSKALGLIVSIFAVTAFFAACGNPAGPSGPPHYENGTTVIANVALTIVGPAYDQQPADKAYPTGNYTFITVSWDPNDNPFAANIAYTVIITVQAKENFAFNNSTAATINNKPAEITPKGNTAAVRLTFDKTDDSPPVILDSINITHLTAPKTNQLQGDAGFSATGTGFTGTLTWSPPRAQFQGGVEYTANITFYADPGHRFANNINVYYNGQTLFIVRNTGEELEVSRTFPRTLVHIASINVEITAPVRGSQRPVLAASASGTTAGGSNFTAGAVSASQITWTPNVGSNFTAQKVYTAEITLTAAADYTFVDLAGAAINGNALTTFTKVSDTEVTLTLTFDATAPLPPVICRDIDLPITVEIGQNLSLQLTLVQGENVTWSGASGGFSISSTGLVSGSRNIIGNIDFTATAANAYDYDTFSFTIIVWELDEEFVYEGFTFKITQDGGITFIEVHDFDGDLGRETVVIPAYFGGYPVTEIGAQAFQNNPLLRTLTLPDNIRLDNNAFAGAPNLQTIHIGANVQFIGGSSPGFPDNFWAVYTNPAGNNRAAGTFTREGNTWTRTP